MISLATNNKLYHRFQMASNRANKPTPFSNPTQISNPIPLNPPKHLLPILTNMLISPPIRLPLQLPTLPLQRHIPSTKNSLSQIIKTMNHMSLPLRMIRMIMFGVELLSEFQTAEAGHDLVETVDLVEAGDGVAVDTCVGGDRVGVWDVSVVMAWEADEASAVFFLGLFVNEVLFVVGVLGYGELTYKAYRHSNFSRLS